MDENNFDKCEVREDVEFCKGCDFCGRMTILEHGGVL